MKSRIQVIHAYKNGSYGDEILSHFYPIYKYTDPPLYEASMDL